MLHEFSTIPGIREDVTDIILNLKQLCFRLDGEAQVPVDLHVDIQKEGVLTAGELERFCPPELEILNPDLVIATMDEVAHLVMDVRIERGKGYVPSTKNKKDDDVIGRIPIDSIFSPILRAKYEVSDVRVGNEMDFDKLTLEVVTNGSITAAEAVARSANIMIGYLKNFTKLAHSVEEFDVPSENSDLDGKGEVGGVDVPDDDGPSKILIDDLELSVRAYNCLKRASINTIADLLDKSMDDLGKVRNLGKKSIDEIEEKLQKHPLGPFYLKKKGE